MYLMLPALSPLAIDAARLAIYLSISTKIYLIYAYLSIMFIHIYIYIYLPIVPYVAGPIPAGYRCRPFGYLSIYIYQNIHLIYAYLSIICIRIHLHLSIYPHVPCVAGPIPAGYRCRPFGYLSIYIYQNIHLFYAYLSIMFINIFLYLSTPCTLCCRPYPRWLDADRLARS